MSSGQHAHFTLDGAQRIEGTTVKTFTLFQNQAAQGGLLDVVKGLIHHRAGDLVFAKLLAEFGSHFIFDGAYFLFALELGHGEQRFHNAIAAAELLGFLKDSGRHHEQLIADVSLFFAAFFGEFFLSLDLRNTTFLAKL